MNNELRLTDEQAEKAAEVTNETFKSLRWGGGWGELLRAAAPFLQAPLAEPTEEEMEYLEGSYWDNDEQDNGGAEGRRRILKEFVARRNAPPTVDPRREKIVSLLRRGLGEDVHELANTILSVVDEAGK